MSERLKRNAKTRNLAHDLLAEFDVLKIKAVYDIEH